MRRNGVIKEMVGKVLEKITKTAPVELDPFAALDRIPGVSKLDAAEELERRREINRRGAGIRAERAAIWDELMSGRSRWIPRRPGWLAPRRGWLR